jgi:hypothetical protein
MGMEYMKWSVIGLVVFGLAGGLFVEKVVFINKSKILL